jgi:hypothetical protein
MTVEDKVIEILEGKLNAIDAELRVYARRGVRPKPLIAERERIGSLLVFRKSSAATLPEALTETVVQTRKGKLSQYKGGGSDTVIIDTATARYAYLSTCRLVRCV